MTQERRPRSPRLRAVIAGAALLLAIGLAALGVWQLERREWKHALIAAVAERSHGQPIPAPGPAAWPRITAQSDAYRRVTATGHFRHDRETLVQAVTDYGGGFWVLTPLETPRFTVLVNRGFVPPDKRDPASRTAGNGAGPVTVTGLLRATEPGGGFLRANDPAAGKWYSRDVAAIAAARDLPHAAPYFIDADKTANPGGYPIGGLTVVAFSDNHLVYALTWLALALLACWSAWYILRHPASDR